MANAAEKPKKFRLKQIYFYLTEGCNLACRHCWLSPKLQNDNASYPTLPVKLFRSIVREAKPLGLTTVKLTGGEPLMYPGITEIFQILKDENIRLSMETNGILCTPGLAKEIASFGDPSVAVSLDGSDAETHEWVRGIKGSFDAAYKGISNLVEAGLKPQVIFTVMKHNKDQLEGIVRLAESLKASSIKFNVVQPTGRGEKLGESGDTLSIEELMELGNWVNGPLSASTSIKLHYDLPMAFRPLSKMFGPKGDGCTSCGILEILGVLANGKYALCGIGSHVEELIFGDAAIDPLEKVWKTHPVLLELREGMPVQFEGVCGKCHMKRACLGSCIAQNYYRAHNLWAPYWYCEEAHNKGLFPVTRLN